MSDQNNKGQFRQFSFCVICQNPKLRFLIELLHTFSRTMAPFGTQCSLDGVSYTQVLLFDVVSYSEAYNKQAYH